MIEIAGSNSRLLSLSIIVGEIDACICCLAALLKASVHIHDGSKLFYALESGVDWITSIDVTIGDCLGLPRGASCLERGRESPDFVPPLELLLLIIA